MAKLRSLVEGHRFEILDAVRRHRGIKIALFGSVARGDEHDQSDIDFLVTFAKGSSLFDLMHLQAELSEILGLQVDVISEGGLRGAGDPIRKDLVAL